MLGLVDEAHAAASEHAGHPVAGELRADVQRSRSSVSAAPALAIPTSRPLCYPARDRGRWLGGAESMRTTCWRSSRPRGGPEDPAGRAGRDRARRRRGRRAAAGRARLAPPRADHARGRRRPGRGPRLPERHVRERRRDLTARRTSPRRPAARRRDGARAPDGRDGRAAHGAPGDPRGSHRAAAAAGGAGRRDDVRQVAPALARPESEPDYVPPAALGQGRRSGALPAARRAHEGEGGARRSGSSCSSRSP